MGGGQRNMITSFNSTGKHMNGKHAVLRLPIFAIVKLKGELLASFPGLPAFFGRPGNEASELLPQITALDISTSHGC